MKQDTQAAIFVKLSLKSGWEERAFKFQKNFDIKELSESEGFTVLLTSKGLENVTLKLSFLPQSSSFHQTDFKLPNLPQLTAKQEKHVNQILTRKRSLWMLTSRNSELLRFDLSRGYKGLNNEELFNQLSDEKSHSQVFSRFDGKHALLYYKNINAHMGDEIFYVIIDMKKESILDASWLTMSLLSSFDEDGKLPRMLLDDEFRFIDESLRKYGDFKTGDSVSSGLDALVANYKVSISFHEATIDKEASWSMSVDPLSGYGHHLSFTINAKTGVISEPLAMHMMPSPIPDLDLPVIAENWDDPLETVKLSMPKLSKDSEHLSDSDRAYINQSLQSTAGTLLQEGLAVFEKDFSMKRQPDDEKYVLDFTLKEFPHVVARLIVGNGPMSIQTGSPELSKLTALDEETLLIIDQILKREKRVWMSTPGNHDLVNFDLSLGIKGLVQQDLSTYSNMEMNKSPLLTQTQLNEDVAVVCFKRTGWGGSDPFCIWVDLKSKSLLGANWFSFPRGDGQYISSTDRDFINRSLKKSEASFLNKRYSLESLLDIHKVELSSSKGEWWIGLGPKEGGHYFQSFSIDKKTGKIGQPMTGHN